MAGSSAPNPIEQARALIAARRYAEARDKLTPLRGHPALVGPVEMLMAYSFLGEANATAALAALRRIPAAIDAAMAFAVGRMLVTCDAGALALDRFRRILIEQPAHGEAVAAAGEAAGIAAQPSAALALADRARVLGRSSVGLSVARIRALLDLGWHQDAADLLSLWNRSGEDVDAILAMVDGKLQGLDQAIRSFDRVMAIADPELLARPRVARHAAAAAFACGDAERAAQLIARCGAVEIGGISLSHEVALERGDRAAASAALSLAHQEILKDPGLPGPTIALPGIWLRTRDHDSGAVLRWAARGACLAGSALKPGPDMLFAECVRWKNDRAHRLSGHGVEIAHALGALAAEAALGAKVSARNGATHAHLGIAGREIALRLTSNQIRKSTRVMFAMEPGMLRWFAGFAPADVLVDVGANIGMYSVLAAGISGCRVIAIEPFSLNVEDLRHNVAINGLDERVTVMHAAATDRERVDTLYFGQSFAGAANQSFGQDAISEQYVDREAGREQVRGVPLDTLVANGEVPFPTHVKIDVDGFEEPVIEGMRGILSDPRFKSLRMEVRWQQESRRPFIRSILAHGFVAAVADDVKNLLFSRPPSG